MKKHYLLLLPLLLQACESPPVRREEMLVQHPEWEADQVELIRKGYLSRGMTTDQVKAAWGHYCYTCPGTTKGSWGESWEYETQIVFFDQEGKLVRWVKK